MTRRALVLAGLALAACDCEGGSQLDLVDAQLIVTPSAIDFGTVARGSSSAHPLQLVNIGPGAVTVSRLDVTGSTAMRIEAPALPFTLAAGGEQTLSVIFAPVEGGDHTAGIGVLADDREDAHPVEVHGVASEATLCVSPTFIPFNRADGEGEQLVTLSACGDAPVTVEGLDFEASDGSLTLRADPPPIVLDPGERRLVRIHHAPPNTTSAAGAVLTVRGSGTPATTAVVITASPEIVPSAAGQYLYYWQVSTENGSERSNIMRLSLQAGGQPEVFWGNSTGNGCPGCHHVSPDGRYLALIERGAGLSVIDTATRQQIRMPGSAERANGMSWRPEVTTNPPYQLVYSADGRLHKASVLDGDLGELANSSTTATATAHLAHIMPTWSSDGRIAYVVGEPTARRDWALQNGAQVMIIPQEGGTPLPLAGASTTAYASYYPSFSPDGKWLALTESALGTTYSSADARVVLVASDGSGLRRELPGVNALGSSRCYPAWSLDGKYLGFSVSMYNGGRGDWDVYYVPIDPATGLETGSPGMVPRANGVNFEHGVEWGR